MSNQVDPTTNTQLPVISLLLQNLAPVLLFMASGHHMVLSALVRSFEAHPPGAFPEAAPSMLLQLQDATVEAWVHAQGQGMEPVLLVRSPLMRHLADMFCRLTPPIPVLSFNEIVSACGVDSAGLVELPDGAAAQSLAPDAPTATTSSAQGRWVQW